MTSRPLSERVIIGALMRWAINDKYHRFVIPNCHFYKTGNENDLISVTRSGYAHEYEVKTNFRDYCRDFEKRMKHWYLTNIDATPVARAPSYFWYAISGFDLHVSEVPDYAGLLRVQYNPQEYTIDVSTLKEAPRLHSQKITEKQIDNIAAWLSTRLSDMYLKEWRLSCAKRNEGEQQ